MIANLSVPDLPALARRFLGRGNNSSSSQYAGDNIDRIPFVGNQEVWQFGVDAPAPRVAAPQSPDNQDFLITVDISILSIAAVVSIQLGLTPRTGYLLHPRDYKRPSLFSETA